MAVISGKSTLVLGLLLSAAAAVAPAQVADKPGLTLDGARKVIAAAAEAKHLNAPGGVVAVVDDGGNLIALERLADTSTYLDLACGLLSPAGKHLGKIVTPEHPHNFAWGDEDGRSLYICARMGLYRIRLKIPGIRP